MPCLRNGSPPVTHTCAAMGCQPTSFGITKLHTGLQPAGVHRTGPSKASVRRWRDVTLNLMPKAQPPLGFFVVGSRYMIARLWALDRRRQKAHGRHGDAQTGKLSRPLHGPTCPPSRRQTLGPIAQRLEQRTHNPLVPGSNPGGPTISISNSVLGRPKTHRKQGI
ncbi:hypothetical protein XFF6166_110006 [Xanthomonas citri pv. fuscans]|nr:hypothetical protein XFF6166_110006 [Xanthomonas citri pv. fuscans]SOO03963.1 hypothetical protein XFF6960_90051 [Xanthomonas citri pv. fuscans]SOO04704.1 hypothetical protein XFF7767_280052 [Xanthomonas citri pv. fuscans]SOO08157.1 hypothetical protein XFF6970_160003 [Xanthomonas citri pv. fuscans]SOO16836.1 hypothetical protein XFF7766_890030 [Xanthomonas citri pv. fuscans]